MNKKQKNKIRLMILAAAKSAGIENANQFGTLCVKIGVLVQSHAAAFHNGQKDISTRKASQLLAYFGLTVWGKRG